MTQDQLLKIIEQAEKEGWTELSLIGEGLTELPPEIGRLSNLTTLSLLANQLTALPPEIGRLSNLTTLNLRVNQLTALPPEIGRLSNLTKLYLDHNQLTELPSEIGNLSALETLYLDRNNLGALPITFRHLEKLTKFDLLFARYDPTGQRADGNHNLKFPPQDVVGHDDVAAIRRYLNAVAAGHETLWESKCVVVGEGGVGKTWLINALQGHEPDETIVGTEGIDIEPLTLPHPTEPDVMMQLNCWDFAGQDFNHAMHQFFFGDRALILLVWNARHGWEQGKLTRWLENIKVRAPHAPVLLVATHIDQPHSDYPKAELRRDYRQIVDFLEVSSKTGENIPQLRHAIQTHAAQLPLMGVKWPSTWRAAADTLRALCPDNKDDAAQTHTTRSRAYALIRPHGLDTAEADMLLHWLHQLGDILNFADEPAIADYVLLNPEWLTKGLGKVLRSDEVLRQRGILSQTHLLALWRDLDEQIRTLFLHIMDKFDLAYLIPNDPEHRSLIVERLPLDPPDYETPWGEFAGRHEITLRFKLDSMQPGIPTWFIARCHRFTLGRGGNEGIHWHNGVLFQDEAKRHRALVIANDRTNEVEMRVRGSVPQAFMSLLRDGFLDTLKRYAGLQIEQWIPCSGTNKRRGEACSAEFDLSVLEEILDDPDEQDKTISCYVCRTKHDVYELVQGIGRYSLTETLTIQHIKEAIQESNKAQTVALKTHISQNAADLAQFVQRNFLRAFLMEQQRDLITCPNLFTIYPIAVSGTATVKRTWHIQLYSQLPGDWRKAGPPYEIDEPREWVKKAAPYLRLLHQTLKFIVPVAGAALNVAGDALEEAQKQHTIFENEIDLMGKLFKNSDFLLPEAADGTGAYARHAERYGTEQLDGRGNRLKKVDGADLVVIRELMDKLAAIDDERGTPKWGGLTRRQTPEGDILWLDQEHLQTYRSERTIPKPPDHPLLPSA